MREWSLLCCSFSAAARRVQSTGRLFLREAFSSSQSEPVQEHDPPETGLGRWAGWRQEARGRSEAGAGGDAQGSSCSAFQFSRSKSSPVHGPCCKV